MAGQVFDGFGEVLVVGTHQEGNRVLSCEIATVEALVYLLGWSDCEPVL